MLSESPRPPVLVINCLYIGSSYDPFLRLITCYHLSQNSGEHFMYHYQFIIKETNRDPDEEVPRARDGRILSQEGPWFCSCGTGSALPRWKYPLTPKLLNPCHLGIFMKAPLCSMMVKLLAFGDLTQSPFLFSLWRSGGGAESFKLLSKAWSSWYPVLFPKLSRRYCLLSTAKLFISLGEFKGF